MKKLSRILLFIFISLTSISCMDDIDDVLSEENDIDQSNLFIYRALNFWYLYKSKTPELANDYFTYQSEFDVFASSFQTPEAMFDYLLYDKDRFSVLTEDYTILERALQGRNKSTGAVFVSFRFQNKIYLLVRNIISNSDAADKNVVRGNIFYKVNGEEITQNNINELLDAPSLELAKAYFDRDEIIETEETVQLLNTDLDEPSIAMYSILEIEGKKIGYLLYNSFIAKYDRELNDVFRYFKEENIQDLVLDLRYNSGGAISSAVTLNNLITGQFSGKLMYEDEWNKDLQPHYSESVYFSNKNPNSLELNRIVILTQSRTASASELVINSLNPYVDVLQVGMDTRGKYQGSVLVYDSPNFSNKNRNPLHRYAMLPLVLKTKNSIGFTDFDEGLPADVFFEEKVGHFQNNLGTTEEPLLRTALEALGFSLPQAKTSDKLILLEVQDYDKALDNIMYLEAIE